MPRPKSTAGAFVELVAIVAFAIGLALLIQAYVVKPYQIPSGSMIPTLEINQRVLVNRLAYKFGDPSIGDIVVFHPPPGRRRSRPDVRGAQDRGRGVPEAGPAGVGHELHQAVVAGPGDKLSIHNGHPVVNGVEADESFIEPVPRDRRRLRPPEDDHDSTRYVLHDGRQPWLQRRQPLLGTRAQGLDHRQGLCHLLAPKSNRHLLSRTRASAEAAAGEARSAGRKRPDGRRTAWLFRFDQNFGCRYVAGADEAGRGCLAGPLVAAGVLLRLREARRRRAQDARRPRRLEAQDRGGARGAVPGRPRLRGARRQSPRAARQASMLGGCT